MKRRSRPPTLTSIRRACQWLGRCGCALRACRGHRHADQRIAARQLLDDLMAQIVPRAHQPVALRTRSLPVQQERCREVRSVKQGHGVILAAQLRCQAQFAAVHGAELGIKHFVAVCVHQASGADLRPGREAMLVAAAAQFDSILRGVRADQTTPSTASTRSGWRTFTAGRLQAWVSRANSSAKGARPGAGGLAR